MIYPENWIWLPKERYPDYQTGPYYAGNTKDAVSCVAEFARTYTFDKNVVSARLRFSGDALFQLYCNDAFLATGPVAVGGDFLFTDRLLDNYYASCMTIEPGTNTLSFFARVLLRPLHICEFSKGHGGFMLSAELRFADGTCAVIATDESWKVRYNGACTHLIVPGEGARNSYDDRIVPDAWMNAEVIPNIWKTTDAPIPVREEYAVVPGQDGVVCVDAHSETQAVLELDRIYGAFISLDVQCSGLLEAEVVCSELTMTGPYETFTFTHDGSYRGFMLYSAGRVIVTLKNHADTPARVTVRMLATHYPVSREARTLTSDADLNRVFDVCRHTLRICRQSLHLDSTSHCEPMACTGDYYIESLMTVFSFGDMRLAAFDVARTAQLLRARDGRMFHTTYSLIWVQMLYDCYRYTGDLALLEECKDALMVLLARFAGYVGDNGLIETPPDYMFIDWIYIDEISMHHPPKALGQSCLNMYYFGALETAEKIYRVLGEYAMAEDCRRRAESLRTAINTLLYDAQKGMYFEGLNTPTPEYLLGEWMPQNVEKRYYLKQSNTLAAYFGVCDDDTARMLIGRIMHDECPGDLQPYFMHYLFEAIYRRGLREEYTLKLAEKWKAPTAECSKGLTEGFVKPEPTYSFDHSHAWGGTPLYSVPLALTGLEVLEPGMKTIRLNPSLLGLTHARVELPTAWGDVVCELEEGKAPVITHPAEVKVYLA